jgi:8-oxo-dGTP pyrophosphatase MutT (NUDIX family)
MLRRVRVRRLVPAAVLVPLVEHPDGLTVLLTRRADDLKHHPGQISFPGGRLEPADAGPAAAALRETHEETGLAADRVEIVGYLDNYLTITGYSVTPVVGFVRPGFDYVPDTTEVAEIFEVPLAHLFDPANVVRRYKRLLGIRVPYYEIPYGPYHIWGATAGMIVGFRGRVYREDDE